MIRSALCVVSLLTAASLAMAQAPQPVGRSGFTGKARVDIAYAGNDNPRQRLDLYLPETPKTEKLPVIVYIHGGAWRTGNKSSGAGRVQPYVKTGEYAGVSVGYRLTDEAAWPAQIHDVKAAIRWIRANAKEHGLDADHIAVWGESAGGHLALMLGTSGDVPELEGSLGPHGGVGSQVACVANYYGVVDIPAMLDQPSTMDHALANSPEGKLVGGAVQEHLDRARAASPATYLTANDPPVLTIHGDADRTVPYPQSALLEEHLRRLGVVNYRITVEGAGHGGFPPTVHEPTAAFFAKHLQGRDVAIPTTSIRKP